MLLSRGEIALVDDADLGAVSRHKWRAAYRYTPSGTKVLAAVVTGRGLTLSRFLLKPADGFQANYIDGNPLNNARANLRACDHAGKMRNSKKRRNNKSGFKGVWAKTSSTGGTVWRAGIRVNGKTICLGTYPNKVEAHEAYCVAAVEYHGDFASAG